MDFGVADTFIKHAPYIGAQIIIVVLFLRYLTHRDLADVKAQDRRDAAWKLEIDRSRAETAELFARYHNLAHEQMAVLRENSTALSAVVATMRECIGVRRVPDTHHHGGN